MKPLNITGDKTVYFTLLYSSGNRPREAFSTKLGPLTGPLTAETYDVNGPYVRQSCVYRLDVNGEYELLWDFENGYAKPEYDPDYVQFLKLKAKYEDA